jgi:cytochrome c biogenesis protein CcmG, thiol:disulfide interchange protein DsbE
MKRIAVICLATAFTLTTLTACGGGDAATGDSTGARADAPRKSRRVEIGQMVPAYDATPLTGPAADRSLAALRGRVVLLNVWATWCVPCRTELPDLEAIHTKYADRGLVVVGVSIDDGGDAARVRDFATERGVTYPLWHDPLDRISGLFLANGVPATYLVGRDGALRWRWMGPLTREDPALNAEIEQALGAE